MAKVMGLDEIKNFLSPIGESLGIEVIEVEFKQGKNPSMTVYIDRDGGIDLNACEAFHKAIDEPLDELDPTFGAAYTLNVSSLGLDRPFKTDRDFLKNIGEEVEIKLYAPLKGKKLLEGILREYDGNTVSIDCGEAVKIEINKIAKISKLIKI